MDGERLSDAAKGTQLMQFCACWMQAVNGSPLHSKMLCLCDLAVPSDKVTAPFGIHIGQIQLFSYISFWERKCLRGLNGNGKRREVDLLSPLCCFQIGMSWAALGLLSGCRWRIKEVQTDRRQILTEGKLHLVMGILFQSSMMVSRSRNSFLSFVKQFLPALPQFSLFLVQSIANTPSCQAFHLCLTSTSMESHLKRDFENVRVGLNDFIITWNWNFWNKWKNPLR